MKQILKICLLIGLFWYSTNTYAQVRYNIEYRVVINPSDDAFPDQVNQFFGNFNYSASGPNFGSTKIETGDRIITSPTDITSYSSNSRGQFANTSRNFTYMQTSCGLSRDWSAATSIYATRFTAIRIESLATLNAELMSPLSVEELCNPVRINVTGCQSFYSLEYTDNIASDNWRTYTPYGLNQPFIDFDASTITDIDPTVGPIYVRARYTEGTADINYSEDYLTLDFLACPPFLEDIETEDTSCFDANDGSVTFSLEENIDGDQEIRFFIVEGELPNRLPTQEDLEEVNLEAIFGESVADPIFNEPNPTPSYEIMNLSGGSGTNFELDYFAVYQVYNEDGTVSTAGITEDTFTIRRPLGLTLQATQTSTASCVGENSIYTLVADGGYYEGDTSTPTDYTYEYSINGGTPQPTSATLSITATDALQNIRIQAEYIGNTNECKSDINLNSFTIPAASPAIVIDDDPLQSSAIPPSAAGLDNGSIQIYLSEGVGPFDYVLEEFDENSDSFVEARIIEDISTTDYTFSNLTVGRYRVRVAPANQTTCSDTSIEFDLIANALPTIESITQNPPSCQGEIDGSITAVVNGGVAPLQYRWYDSFGIEVPGQYTTTLENLAAGTTYSFRAISNGGDFNISGAYASAVNILVSDASDIQILDVTPTATSCFGSSDGSLLISASGATTYYYSLNGGLDWTLLPDDNIIPNLSGGYYELLLGNSDQPTCFSDVFTNIQIPEPEIISVNSTSNPATTNGGFDGSISISISGGTPILPPISDNPYTITWEKRKDGTTIEFTDTDLSTPYEITGLEAATYIPTIFDARGCTTDPLTPIEIIVDQPGELSIETLLSTNSCNGLDNGTISATIQGTGDIVFDFLLEPGESTESIVYTITTAEKTVIASNLASGIYGLRITEVTTNEVRITEPVDYITISELSDINAIVTPTPIACDEFNTGIIAITDVEGGNGNYLYQIDDGFPPQTLNTFSNLAPRTYFVTVIDNLGCEFNTSIDIIQEEAPVLNPLTTIATNASSETASDGSIVLDFEDDSTDYTYNWVGTGVSINNVKDQIGIPVGSYQVTVTASGNCILEEEFTISEQDEFSIAPLTGTPTLCFDKNNGSITATIEATGLVTYIWRLEDGTEIETIPDSDLREITLDNLEDGGYYLEATNENTTITSDIFSIDRLPEITATILTTRTCFGDNTGTILFTDPVGSPSGSFLYSIDNGATTQTTPLFEDLPEGIYFPRLSTVENNNCDFITNEVRILPSPDLIYDEPNTIITRASDPEASDGTISVAIQGGTPPYSYAIDSGLQQNTNVFNNLSEGTYEITITDSAGCVEPALIEVTAIGPLTISNIVPNDALCRNEANGSITTTVTGEPIFYEWTLADGSPVPVSNGVNTQNLEGILAGDYVLTVTDEITTVTSEVISVGEPATSLTILDIITTDVSCFDGSDGSIEIQAAGGTGNYTYSINGIDFQPELIFDGLEANNYTVTVRDENLCEFQEPTFVVINASSELNIAVTEQIPTSAANAFDGAIYITPEGGSDNYTYLWSGPNGFTSNEQDITNLEAGTYNVIITDTNFNINNDVGCQFISEDIIVTEPGQLVATINQTEFIACSGDASAEIIANVQGGVPPYTYQWYEDDNGNDIPLEEESDIINNLANGTYFLIATDDNGIFTESNRVDVTQPNLLVITQNNVTDILCAGESTGAISIRVSGGTPPYQYYWSNNETVPDINGLEAGEYTIEVEDSEGCIASQSIVVASPNEAVVISDATVTDASEYEANDGSIAIDVTGGQEPYTYTWIQSSTNMVISNAATISNLTADTYTVLISDFYDCEITEEYEISQPDIIEETILQPSCFGNSDASINLLVNQGNGAFTYLWNTGQTENSIDNLSAGSYTVTVTGFQDGPVTRTYIIENPTPLDINLGVDRVLCANQTLELDASVDDETVTYSWTSENGFTSTLPNVEITATGNYTVTLQSQSGCTSQGTIYVDVSTDEINAEFAVSSQVFTRESSVAVDISYPLPDGIEWILPIQATIETQNTDEVEFSFAEAGEYEITLITTRGECIAQKTKKILVLARDGLISEDDDKSGQKLIEDFLVYPNPSNGTFSADVTLTEIGEINIKVFSFANNALIASKRDRGKISYNIPFDLTGLPVGVYAVLIETPYGQTLRKVIIN